MKKPVMLCILGPTASGKTSLAVDLALNYSGEIISADSMQIYKGFDIGTAKVTEEEMRGVPHYLINNIEPCGSYSVADYCSDAAACARDIVSRGKLPILCGGTGLYINSLTNNVKFFEYSRDYEYSELLEKIYLEKGSEFLWNMLCECDPNLASTVSCNNKKRIIHALEVYKATGKTYEQLSIESKQEPEFDVVKIGLTFSDRQALYNRINLRVDKMIEAGLVEEVKHLLSAGVTPQAQAMNGIGYKEIIQYLNGECSLEQASELIKLNSRRYAKRQMTWFRRDESIFWINVDAVPNIYDAAVGIIDTVLSR